MKPHVQHKTLLQFGIFENIPNLEHFSTTRKGGVSKGEFKSLNLGNYSDDDPLNIFENRSALARFFYKDVDDFITPNQTHGTNVLLIDDAFLSLDKSEKLERLYGIDATITQKKDIFLCATTADCVPILLFDKKNEVIAAVHAGWRGTSGRIVEKTVRLMHETFGTSPADMVAAIGPSIGIENYEVGKEVEKEFKKNGFRLGERTARILPPSKKIHLDLKEINRQELIRLGVPADQIEKTRYNTFKNSRLFFSARRQTIHCGRMLTGIMLK
ncbi:MAG: peptidoglycan editing factor PgeF [Petrimonas sp.]|nr:peptidoglycan editing factor PgeF [Petrimonas sp.]